MKDYRHIKRDIFYEKVYPLFAKEFLLGNDYKTFSEKVSEVFLLSPKQWGYILEHWNYKELILKYDEE